MDLGQTVTTFHTEDHAWLLEVNKHTQMGGTIDPSNAAWEQAQHYSQGFLRSGIAVAYDVAASRYIPFDAAGAGDETNFAGILFNSQPVLENGLVITRSVGVSVMVQGYISLDALPSFGTMVNGGLGNVLATARNNIAASNPTTTLVWIGK